MDRNKQPPGARGSKSKITQQPPELFIALGAKQSGSRDVETKRNVPILPKVSSSSSSSIKSLNPITTTDRKREASSSSLPVVQPAKKSKVISGRPATSTGASLAAIIPPDRVMLAPSGVETWEALAIELEPSELLHTIVDNISNGNLEKAVGYVLGGIKTMRSQRFKPCKLTFNSMLLACQCKPTLFTNEHILAAIMSSLRRDIGAGAKNPSKSNIYNQIAFINLLLHSFADVNHWPEVFLRFYVEDAVTERIWIDNPYCKPFVDNIITAFNTKIPPRTLLLSETWTPTAGARETGSPLTINALEDDEATNEQKLQVDNWNVRVYPRYTQMQEVVEQIVLEAIQEQLARRQQPETISKNFVRFLSTACGLVEIRIIAVARIETWLHNHKLMKPAQELLAYLCYNCLANTQRDLEVVVQLSKLRLKNKPMVNFFNNCLREMVLSFPENLYPLLKYTIYNELSNARNTNNLFVVGAMFQVSPDASADAFSDICLELLLNKDDYLRSLRALLKEINRVLRNDFNLLNIVHSLLRERKDFARDSEFKDRIFLSLADLVCMCMLLCVSPQVRDAASQSKRDVAILQQFQTQVSNIQREAVTWLHDWAYRSFRPNIVDFQHVLHKVLFLEQPEHYYKVDSWPGENERNLFIRLVSDVPLMQATLLRILLIGISKENPLSAKDVIEIGDQLIRRAANLPPDCTPLAMDKIEIIDFFFNLCSYNYPENISLPAGYVPPKLAISALYWKSWFMLLILAAHNPASFGELAWNKYPTLRMFMEMCITNHFSYPPPTMLTGEGADEFNLKDQQTLVLEKQNILEFESHLAAASSKIEINEQTSLLLPQLMELKPQSDARRPPVAFLDQLQILNNTHRLGHLLCRSRHPDFLLEIMSRQGGTAHMPWLAELVHSSEGALAHLPVQCLCEYLLSTGPTEKLTKHTQLLAHLRTVVNGPDPQNACEVLEYLLRRLTSLIPSNRTPAIKALTLVLAPSEETELSSTCINKTYWLTQYILQFPHLQTVRPVLIQFLRQAILIETNPVHVSNYIKFLGTNGMDDPMPELLDLVYDLATIIVERNSITSYILLGDNIDTLKSLLASFWLYFQKLREPTDDNFHWSENQDQVVITWANGDQCTIQILIVHASIILLTFGPIDNYEPYQGILDCWFPINQEPPKSYLVDTSEEALMVPDWLRLRMIRSNVPRLLKASVENLEAAQLVLFIQSFGIPVASITKLLQILDLVSEENPRLVLESVIDKNYMVQLVDIQNRRGAVGGENFVRALEMQIQPIQDDDYEVVVDKKSDLPVATQKICNYNNVSSNELYQNLNKVFDINFSGDIGRHIQFLCKIIATNPHTSNKIFDYIHTIPPNTLINFIHNQKTSSSMLFRLLFLKKHANNEVAVTLANKISNYIKELKNPTSEIIKQFLQENKKNMDSNKMETDEVIQRKIIEPKELLKQINMVTDKKSENLLKHFLQDTKAKVEIREKIGGKRVKKMVEPLESLGDKLGKLLLENEEVEKTGLLVDWLSAVELEMANTDGNKLQMELLFSKKQLSFRPLLLSIVLQRASWKTLNHVIDYLFGGNVTTKCPVSVLDFLAALKQCPRLWQGRDKAIPKHHRTEDVLHFNTKQLLVLVEFILEEANTRDNWEKHMESRLALIIDSIGDAAEPIVKKLINISDNDKAPQLLLMLYMNLPRIGHFLNTKHFSSFSFSKNSHSAVDVISHTILSALTATTRMKDWTKRSQELELCARKLTATHPDLVLRQLPMLAGSLRGRSQYDWNVLKSRGHFLLFGQVLGLMELLQPKIFEQTATLCSILDSYFILLRFHGHMKDLNIIVGRIVTFLQNWMIMDIQHSLKYLQQYGHILNDIQFAQPSVRPLLSSVTLPIQDQNNPNEQLLIGAPTPPIPQPMPPHWQSLANGIQSPDPLTALQEIEHLTSKRPQILGDLSQDLFDCICSHNSQVRTVALTLVVRLLKHYPTMSKEALPSILSCLDSRDADVVKNIIDRLPELVVVMQEYAKDILTRVYHLGVKSNLNACNNIGKCIATLSLQSGC